VASHPPNGQGGGIFNSFLKNNFLIFFKENQKINYKTRGAL
jgi:hypothetical protein